MRNTESKTIDLRDQLSKALQAGRFTQALDLYELIEKRKPDEPRWAHRKGDLLRRMGREPDAVIAYERAVHLYSAKGFDARATATAKLVLTLDPNRGEVLEWANSVAARGFEQQSGNAIPLTY
jgi:tetratricopeptide (TPR) repeat protein